MNGRGVRDDVAQVRAGRLPAQVTTRLVARGDRRRGVARAPRCQLDRDGVAGALAGRVDYLLDAVAVAVAEVVDLVRARLDGVKGEQVRVRQVRDVDVVADAGAVRGRVVVAVHHELVALAAGDLEHDRDQVGLRGVPLAQAAALLRQHGAGRVEVAQRRGAEPE